MKKFKTLTIGISAHNEEAGIGRLLDSILVQKEFNYALESVIIVCDGCSDKTSEIVKKYFNKFKNLYLIDDGKRLGKAARLNEIYKRNESDVVLILDADVVLSHPRVIGEIVGKFDNSKVGLVGGCNLPLAPRNFFEKVVNTWLGIWFDIRKNINHGVSVHNNLGCVSALRKDFAKNIVIPNNLIPDDDFTYFSAIKLGYKFKFAKNAIVNYRTVDNLQDFFIQHSRLLYSKNFVKEYFGDWVNPYYRAPFQLKLKSSAVSFIKDPLFTILAFGLQLIIRVGLNTPKESYTGGYWTTAGSSKFIDL